MAWGSGVAGHWIAFAVSSSPEFRAASLQKARKADQRSPHGTWQVRRRTAENSRKYHPGEGRPFLCLDGTSHPFLTTGFVQHAPKLSNKKLPIQLIFVDEMLRGSPKVNPHADMAQWISAGKLKETWAGKVEGRTKLFHPIFLLPGHLIIFDGEQPHPAVDVRQPNARWRFGTISGLVPTDHLSLVGSNSLQWA